MRFDPDAFFLTEGSVSVVEVFDVSRELADRNHSRDWRPFFRMQLAPGRYEVKTYRRPCDGSCQALNPPRDACAFDVEMTDDGANRLVVVRVRADGACHVSDKGDVIDFDTMVRVTDYGSFTHSLEDAEYEVRHGERSGGPFFSVPGQFVHFAGQQLQVYEYPSREKLDHERSSISPRGDSLPTEDGGIAIVHWGGPPHFYSSGKLLVLYIGDKPVVLEVLNLVLGPQFAGR